MSHCRISRFILTLLPIAPLCGQVATYSNFGSGCPGTGAGLGTGHAIPQQYATTFMPGLSAAGLNAGSQRYQQVFSASELPAPLTMAGMALRWDNQTFRSISEVTYDMEIHVGYTTRTPTTLSTTFAANFDSGTPVTVLPRSFVTFPAMPSPPATNPLEFRNLMAWSTVFQWVPQPGLNLLVEWVSYGSTGNGYVCDAGNHPSLGWTYGYATSTTAILSGSGFGYEVMFYEFTNSAVPTLTAQDVPQFGAQVPIDLDHACPGSVAFLVTGFSNWWYATTPLPLSLAGLGAPGCSLLVSLDSFPAVPTNSAGHARGYVDVPMNFALAGLRFYNQFLVFDPTANPLGLVVSGGGIGVIGN